MFLTIAGPTTLASHSGQCFQTETAVCILGFVGPWSGTVPPRSSTYYQ
jgi:hypothetical protein